MIGRFKRPPPEERLRFDVAISLAVSQNQDLKLEFAEQQSA